MNDIDWNALARYFAGECSPEEQKAIEAWLDADPARYRLMEELRRIWEASASADRKSTAVDLEDEWEALSRRMEVSESSGYGAGTSEVNEPDPGGRRTVGQRSQAPGEGYLSQRRSPGQRMSWALALLIMVVGGVWVALQVTGSDTSGDAGEVFQEVVTERGERTHIRLPDETEVIVNAESQLTFLRGYEEGAREARLSGEAYFKVPVNDRPFLVRTGKGEVEVHGTAFSVRAYDDDNATQVAVEEGRVSLRPQKTSESSSPRADLSAGQLGRVEENRLVTEQNIDIASYLGWTENRIVFDDQPLGEAAKELERWYGVEFKIEDPELRSLRLTTNIEEQPLSNVLQIVAASLGIDYEIEEETVVLSS